MRNILRKVSYSKIKEIILKKTTKYMRQKIRQNKIKQNHQVEILITQKKIEVVRMEVNLHYFPMTSK